MESTQTELYDIIQQIIEEDWVSDVHVTAGGPIWVRRSGHLSRFSGEEVGALDFEYFLSRLDSEGLGDPHAAVRRAEESRVGGDARSGYDFSATIGRVRCRCNLSLANGGSLSIVLRKLEEKIPEFTALGLPESVLAQCVGANGLVLVTGPTGSGKSTTLASMLNHINQTASQHILTIEDPVEYMMPSASCKVTRKEIGRDAATYLGALRAAMRQDPDIIMLGEVRDQETMRAALGAAETGHLVFATLHTNSAVKTVDRVSSFFPPDEKVWAANVFSTVFRCVISQTLVPRMDGNGRALAYEVMMGTPDVRNNIKEQKINLIANSLSQGAQQGHVLLNSCLSRMVREKIVSREAALAHAYDRDGLAKQLMVAGGV